MSLLSWLVFCQTQSKFLERISFPFLLRFYFHCEEGKKTKPSALAECKNLKKFEWNSPFTTSSTERGLCNILIMQSCGCLLLCVQDWERLHAAFWDMQAFWNMLEWKRKQLEKEEKEHMVVRAFGTTLPQSIRHIQLDLRDLMSQVSSQVSTIVLQKSTHISPFVAHAKTLEEVTDKNSFSFFSR